MKEWILKLEREQEGYFRNFTGPSIDGPGPVTVVEKAELIALSERVCALESALWAIVSGVVSRNCPGDYEWQYKLLADAVLKLPGQDKSQTGRKESQTVAEQPASGRAERYRKASALLEQWSKEPGDYDERVMVLLEQPESEPVLCFDHGTDLDKKNDPDCFWCIKQTESVLPCGCQGLRCEGQCEMHSPESDPEGVC